MMLLFICARGGRLIEVYQSRLSQGWLLTLVYPQYLAHGVSMSGWEIARELIFISSSHRI